VIFITIEGEVDSLLNLHSSCKKKAIDQPSRFKRLYWLILALICVSIGTVLLLPASREWMNESFFGVKEETVVSVGDEPFNNTKDLGYELLDNNSVLHVWNKFDNYYFNTSNGIQFSNHYNEYWTHNVMMLGYYTGDNWTLIYRTDSLSGFDRNLSGETDNYINATLWKDLSYGSYDFRLAIRYHLGVNDSDLTVIPYIRNLGIAIPYVLGFGWELKNIQIANTIWNDQIRINETTYLLNQTLDNSYTNITRTFYVENETPITVKEGSFYLENFNNITGKVDYDLYLRWNPSLTYKVTVKNRTGQYNAPVTLFIRIGTLDVNQEKSTELHWHDAWVVDSYSETNQNNHGLMKDLHPSDHASYSSAYGQSFNGSNVSRLVQVTFYLRKTGSPTGNAHVVLYNHSGVFGSSSIPGGDVLATSDNFDVSALTDTYTLYNFTFSGGEQYVMSADTHYCIVYQNPESGTIDGSNYVWLGVDTSSPTHQGNLLHYKNSAWLYYADYDGCFYSSDVWD